MKRYPTVFKVAYNSEKVHPLEFDIFHIVPCSCRLCCYLIGYRWGSRGGTQVGDSVVVSRIKSTIGLRGGALFGALHLYAEWISWKRQSSGGWSTSGPQTLIL